MNGNGAVLYFCGGCANKVVDESLPKEAFRCPLVANIINPNIVRETTDATDCVKEGRYCSLYNDETKL